MNLFSIFVKKKMNLGQMAQGLTALLSKPQPEEIYLEKNLRKDHPSEAFNAAFQRELLILKIFTTDFACNLFIEDKNLLSPLLDKFYAELEGWLGKDLVKSPSFTGHLQAYGEVVRASPDAKERIAGIGRSFSEFCGLKHDADAALFAGLCYGSHLYAVKEFFQNGVLVP